MLFYFKFRTKVDCPIKQEFSEKTEHNQISTNFFAFAHTSTLTLVRHLTFKHYNSSILDFHEAFKTSMCKQSKVFLSLIVTTFPRFLHLKQAKLPHSCIFGFYPIPVFCSKFYFYLALFLLHCFSNNRAVWVSWFVPSLSSGKNSPIQTYDLSTSFSVCWFDLITLRPRCLIWCFGAP